MAMVNRYPAGLSLGNAERLVLYQLAEMSSDPRIKGLPTKENIGKIFLRSFPFNKGLNS
jgi:hypothetical protein